MSEQIEPSSVDHPLYEKVVAACQGIYDPEIPINIYDLGLIYTILIDAQNIVDIKMTLTSPTCPVAGDMPGWVAEAVDAVEGATVRSVDLVWAPTWGIERLTEEAKLEFGMI
jgi:FeS assembly SUF system protein